MTLPPIVFLSFAVQYSKGDLVLCHGQDGKDGEVIVELEKDVSRFKAILEQP